MLQRPRLFVSVRTSADKACGALTDVVEQMIGVICKDQHVAQRPKHARIADDERTHRKSRVL